MAKYSSILLIGSLSVFFAEVFAGSSHLWFVDVWRLLLTFPLYLAHTVFLLNLAVRTERTSLRQLYFWGMLFGLYESWITKVLWAGYFDSNAPLFGLFLGVAWAEFSTLVLFWHPVMSFILPILTYEVLSGDYLPGHSVFLARKRWKTLLIFLVLLIGSTFQNVNSKFDLFTSLGSVCGSLVIIFVLDRISKFKDLDALMLGDRGVIILGVYLALLYALTFPLLLPERIPHNLTSWLLILFWYVLSLSLLKFSKPVNKDTQLSSNVYGRRDFLKYMLILVFLTFIMSVLPPLTQVITVIFMFIIIALGPIILSISILKRS